MTYTKRKPDWLRVGGYAALAVVALPAIAAIAFVMRGLLLAAALMALVAGLSAYALSPALRAWFGLQMPDQISYNGLRLATDVAVHPLHGWARIEGTDTTVGGDDLIQATLGPVEDIEMPPVGARLREGSPLLRLYRDGRHLDVRSPVTGIVLATNRTLKWDPHQVNRDPYGAGWLVRMRGEDLRRERKRLLRGDEARQWFRREVDRLVSRLGTEEAVPTLPDGGILVDELHRFIDRAHWNHLVEEFFGGRGRS
jgi:glycine cleavage system H protein